MTPLEKAKYLIEEMKGGCCRCPHDSKEAALTCCDEVIAALISEVLVDGPEPFVYYPNTDKIEYWQQVKKEIEKL